MAQGTILGQIAGQLQSKVEWSSVSNGSAANTSTITATVYVRRTDNFTTTGRSWSGYVAIGGEYTGINLPSSVSVSSNWVAMATGQRVVGHNSDGTKQITIEGSVTGPSGTSQAGNTSYGREDVWLDTIPRYTAINYFAVTKNTETSLGIDVVTSDVCDALWYSIDGGASWTLLINGDFMSAGAIMYGFAANTTYGVMIKVKRKDSQLTTDSGIVYQTTYPYPYCTEAPDFTIGNNVTISLYNPLNRTVQIQMWSHVSQQFVSDLLTINGSSYTGFADVSSRLYESIPSSRESRYNIDVWYSGNKAIKEGGKYFTRGDETPIFSTFAYQDINATTTALTGNSGILVKGYSVLFVIIYAANRAIAKNSARMLNYFVSVGSHSVVSIPYSSSSDRSTTISNVNGSIITVNATDSRNYSTSVSRVANFKEYFPLTINSVTAVRQNNGVGKEVVLSFNGTFWNDNFGRVTNSIKSVTYQYKLTTSSTWETGTTVLTTSTSGNNWSGSATINGDLGAEGFNISNAYDIRLQVSDELVTKTYDVVLTSGTPALSIYKNKVAIGAKYDTSIGGELQVAGKKYISPLELGYRAINHDPNIPNNTDDNVFQPFIIGYDANNPINIDNVNYPYNNTRVEGMIVQSDGGAVFIQMGIITYSDATALHGKFIYRYSHGVFGSHSNWISINLKTPLNKHMNSGTIQPGQHFYSEYIHDFFGFIIVRIYASYYEQFQTIALNGVHKWAYKADVLSDFKYQGDPNANAIIDIYPSPDTANLHLHIQNTGSVEVGYVISYINAFE